MRYCCISIECYSLFIRNACTNHSRALFVNTDECGSRMHFRAQSNLIFAPTCNSINSNPFYIIPYLFAWFSRLHKSVVVDARIRWGNARRDLLAFTGEEDMITSVNYFVVGDTCEKQISARFHKKFTAYFTVQRERNEIIAEWDEILNAFTAVILLYYWLMPTSVCTATSAR